MNQKRIYFNNELGCECIEYRHLWTCMRCGNTFTLFDSNAYTTCIPSCPHCGGICQGFKG